MIDHIQKGQANDHLITGLTGSARPALIHTIYQETNKSIYIVSSNLLQAQKLVDDLTALVGEGHVHYYPAEEFIAANMTTSSHELRAQRIATIGRLVNQERGIYIIPAAGMRSILSSPEKWLGYELNTSIGQDVDITIWLDKLVEMGYTRSEMVTTPGEFAMRGGILDIYPPYAQDPIRIELFDTEVDSIRTFSADNQRSIEKLNKIKIFPAAELLLTKEERIKLAERLEESLAASLKKVRKRKHRNCSCKIFSMILSC